VAEPVFTPFAGALGADVSGVDLRDLDPETLDALRAGFVRYQVLFFHGLELAQVGAAEQLALASAFGEPVPHPTYPCVEGFESVQILEVTPAAAPKIDTWHTDMTFKQRPPLGTVLRATVLPEFGGDTLFASTAAAFEGLSDRMQRYLDGLEAVHSFAHGFRHSLAEPGAAERMAPAVAQNPPVRHPVVRRHPVSGRRGLFVNRLFTTQIVGLSERESDAVLGLLFAQQELPEYTCRLRWRVGSIAFWDNRATLHRPVNDYWPAHRRMERVMIAGDRPQ
jgi:taurine dioxygenase